MGSRRAKSKRRFRVRRCPTVVEVPPQWRPPLSNLNAVIISEISVHPRSTSHLPPRPAPSPAAVVCVVTVPPLLSTLLRSAVVLATLILATRELRGPGVVERCGRHLGRSGRLGTRQFVRRRNGRLLSGCILRGVWRAGTVAPTLLLLLRCLISPAGVVLSTLPLLLLLAVRRVGDSSGRPRLWTRPPFGFAGIGFPFLPSAGIL